MNDVVHLPSEYIALGDDELARRCRARKDQLGRSLLILGHHYQRDEIVAMADFVGDSLKLSQQAAASNADAIVFCGVHFMAESADVLTGGRKTVCLPNLLAGCAMADLADDAAVASAIDELALLAGEAVLPITYVNSTAGTKAVTARFGGACCTSSNVANVFRWALSSRDHGGAGAKRILAVPDRHLGLNTAIALGYAEGDCVLYDPALPAGGLTSEQVRRATFILWKGQCYVHQCFLPSDVAEARRQDERVRVIVHPECPREVVRLADAAGSTEQIIQAVRGGATGSHWAVATESNLVRRLAREMPDRCVEVLGGRTAHCTQMSRIDLRHLLWVLDGLAAGKPVNRVTVRADIADEARLALERMIAIKPQAAATQSGRDLRSQI